MAYLLADCNCPVSLLAIPTQSYGVRTTGAIVLHGEETHQHSLQGRGEADENRAVRTSSERGATCSCVCEEDRGTGNPVYYQETRSGVGQLNLLCVAMCSHGLFFRN